MPTENDHLLVNSQQFGSNYNKLRAIIQAYPNTNKTWIVNDFRETDPNGRGLYKQRQKQKARASAKAKAAKAKAAATARARVLSHETVGHEQITTRW